MSWDSRLHVYLPRIQVYLCYECGLLKPLAKRLPTLFMAGRLLMPRKAPILDLILIAGTGIFSNSDWCNFVLCLR